VGVSLQGNKKKITTKPKPGSVGKKKLGPPKKKRDAGRAFCGQNAEPGGGPHHWGGGGHHAKTAFAIFLGATRKKKKRICREKKKTNPRFFFYPQKKGAEKIFPGASAGHSEKTTKNPGSRQNSLSPQAQRGGGAGGVTGHLISFFFFDFSIRGRFFTKLPESGGPWRKKGGSINFFLPSREFHFLVGGPPISVALRFCLGLRATKPKENQTNRGRKEKTKKKNPLPETKAFSGLLHRFSRACWVWLFAPCGGRGAGKFLLLGVGSRGEGAPWQGVS